MGVYYPPVGFYFKLSFTGVNSSIDYAFQEASGLTAEMGVEEISEGGENRFKHKLPTGTKYTNLIVKRGLVTTDSQLATWCSDTIISDLSSKISPKTINVMLMDADAKPIIIWNFFNAWPVKWNFSDLESTKSEIVVESIEFAYSYFRIINKTK
ncbi:MAG: phage tail protein [Bacteroidota bacterium]|jgi:phage tail-like protein|nr:phage tail protein [Bacteroidota bacterium]MCA6442120.1 phage tail protein [Bacteroidota bacterium]